METAAPNQIKLFSKTEVRFSMELFMARPPTLLPAQNVLQTGQSGRNRDP